MNKTQKRIVEAKERGYTVTDCGKLMGLRDNVIKASISGKQRYPTFSTNWGGIVYGIPIHQFAAYIFFGERAFDDSLVVRHLNADRLDFSKSNIALGTYSENENDKPKEVRVRSAKAARAAQGYRPMNAKLTDDQVAIVRSFYNDLKGNKAPNGSVIKLSEELGVSKTVIHKIKTGEYYV